MLSTRGDLLRLLCVVALVEAHGVDQRLIAIRLQSEYGHVFWRMITLLWVGGWLDKGKCGKSCQRGRERKRGRERAVRSEERTV